MGWKGGAHNIGTILLKRFCFLQEVTKVFHLESSLYFKQCYTASSVNCKADIN